MSTATINGTATKIPPEHIARLAAGEKCKVAALEYLALGWAPVAVCPPDHCGESSTHISKCSSIGKAPVVKWTAIIAGTRPTAKEIGKWWSDRNPSRNVGVIVGGVSGIVGVDIDGTRGVEALQNASQGDLPDTCRFATPSGGQRLLYRIPAGMKLRTTHLAEPDADHEGISYLAEGGHTVMPPSRHKNGGTYAWIPGKAPWQIEPAPAPAWLVKKLLAPEPRQAKSPRVDQRGDQAQDSADLPPADARLVASKCAWLQHCIDDAATLTEPEWHGMVSTVALCTDGPALTHEWSSTYPGYSADETQVKIDRALEERKPHTCGTIAGMTGSRFCAACPARGKVTAPIVLGRVQTTRPQIRNWQTIEVEDENAEPDEEEKKRKTITVPLPMTEVLKAIKSATGGWPRRVGPALFVHERDGEITWLDSPAATFGYLSSKTGIVKWRGGIGLVTKEEATERLKVEAASYTSIATLPHFPPIDGHYYACTEQRPGDGSTLRKLLDCFCPSTEIDSDLLLAMLVTPGWGGPGGCRPAFMVVSDSGRGAGKTKTAAMTGHLWGGSLDFSHNDEIGKIKTRLLSPEGLGPRVCMLDNIKTPKFSWGELEALITAPAISGHKMYNGEGTRPNTLTWLLTLNGASLSTDMAQRVVTIKIDKPKRSGSWEEDTIRFVVENRAALIADVAAFFAQERHLPRHFSRWAAWERDVLSRLPEPDEAQAIILERQGNIDVEREEADILEDYFRAKLVELSYDAEGEWVHIPSALAAEWYNAATNERQKVTGAVRVLGQLCDESRITWLRRNTCKTHGRGFVWSGESAPANATTRTDIADRVATLTRFTKTAGF